MQEKSIDFCDSRRYYEILEEDEEKEQNRSQIYNLNLDLKSTIFADDIHLAAG